MADEEWAVEGMPVARWTRTRGNIDLVHKPAPLYCSKHYPIAAFGDFLPFCPPSQQSFKHHILFCYLFSPIVILSEGKTPQTWVLDGHGSSYNCGRRSFSFLLGNFLAELDFGVLLEHCKFLSLNGFAHEKVKTEPMLCCAACFWDWPPLACSSFPFSLRSFVISLTRGLSEEQKRGVCSVQAEGTRNSECWGALLWRGDSSGGLSPHAVLVCSNIFVCISFNAARLNCWAKWMRTAGLSPYRC